METLPQSPTPPEKMEGGSNASNSNYILIVNVFGALGKRSRPLRGCWAGRQKEAAGKQLARIDSGRNGLQWISISFQLVSYGVQWVSFWFSSGIRWGSIWFSMDVLWFAMGFLGFSKGVQWSSFGVQWISFGFP